MCAIVTLELDTLVEIINGFSEPQADDQERGDTCGIHVSLRIKGGRFRDIPIVKPKIPIQAQARWTMGLSRLAPNLPSLPRKAIRLNRTKKMIENPKEMPMNAGVVAVGADNQRDASLGSTERSKWGMRSRLLVGHSCRRTV